MKKFLLLCTILLSGALLLSASSQESDQAGIKLSITEFGYPLIPKASQLNIRIPIRMDSGGSEKNTEFKVDAWYRAVSPYFLPGIFFEVGIVPSINLLREGKSKLFMGLGTAYSQTSDHVSIPVIVPIEYRYVPLDVLELNLSMQNMIYGEGLISEFILSATLGPLFDSLFIELGGSANVAYSWKTLTFKYSYGLLVGLGYEF